MDNVNEFIKSLNISEDEYVVLACSYGPDSMCLLDILIKNGINVVVAHVNHKLRKESDQEYVDLEEYCLKNNIIFEGSIIDKYPKGNIEAYGRSFRYNFFESIVKKYKAKYLFTAHHGDDLIETILMRIARGASLRGYAGFKKNTKLDNYYLVRPLIYLTKEDILNYVENLNIPYAIDNTNLELIHTRNVYRHKILPILKEINPKIHMKFIKFSDTINECNDYLENEIDVLLDELYKNNRLDLNEFSLLPYLLKKYLLNRILLSIYNNNINRITDEHINLIFALIDGDKVNGSINLPCNYVVTKYYNILEFKVRDDVSDYDYILDDKLNINGGLITFIDETDIKKSNYLIRLNSNDIKMPLHVRNRRVGDKITLKKVGTKKVGEILSESKIPRDVRKSMPIVTDENGKILWIPGVKKSNFDKQYDKEYDIIIKYIKKENEDEK